jgi:LPS export ABC transporter protein LptC
MQGMVTWLKNYLPVLTICLLLFSACENDLNKVRAIAAADATKPIQTTKDVTVIYSDTAVVKAKVTAPLLIQYETKQPYSILPKGVKVIFYDKNLKEEGTIVSDSAVMKNDNKLIQFYKNVVATNTEGTVYKSQELIWDQAKLQIYSNRQVYMTKLGGDSMTGTSFVSDDRLLHPIFQNATAIIHVDDKMTQ